MRTNAFLALTGVASRRKADEFIKAGRVRVNGMTASLNTVVGADDKVEVDNKTVQAQSKRYIILNKPAGYVTTMNDPEGRPKVVDLVDLPERLKPVGRLDYNTSGLLFLTNDGQMANRLMHPSHEFTKTYLVSVAGEITDRVLNLLSNGVELEDGLTAPAMVTQLDKRTISLAIHEGRNRQVRRMISALGLKLKKLHRVGYGPLELTDVPVGSWRELSQEELSELNRVVDAKIKTNGSKEEKN